MRLGNFIIANVEPILADWVMFAGSLLPGAGMTKLALRDHAEDILLATARDMGVPQSLTQQDRKSKGDGAGTSQSDRLNIASTEHAEERIVSGFDIIEVVAEYRALRACVLRLWRQSLPLPDLDDLDDITRFNESIDQSLAQAVGAYTERVNWSRNLFLAILGHDLRSPLNCIHTGVKIVSQTIEYPDSVEKMAIIDKELEAMEELISNLIDFASSWLGGSIPLNRKPLDLQKLCREVVDEFRVTHPQRTLHFLPRGDLTGIWDAARLRQVISNLLGNALQHGSPEGPVEMAASEDGSNVVLSVHNEGPPIPPDAIPTIFDPLMRYATVESTLARAPGSIGLGLFIVRDIVNAKGGVIEITSTEQQGTTFTVRIPRQPAPLMPTAGKRSKGADGSGPCDTAIKTDHTAEQVAAGATATSPTVSDELT